MEVLKPLKNKINKDTSAMRMLVLSSALFIFLSLGTYLHKDYGNSMDESNNRMRGIATLKYIGKLVNIEKFQDVSKLTKNRDFGFVGLPDLEDYPKVMPGEAEHGVLFELFGAFFEKVFDIGYGENEEKIYKFRHLLNFFVFVLGLTAVFYMAERRFSDWRLGLVTVAIVISSPRIFTESFYNSMDIVFLSCFAIATNTAIRFLLNTNYKNAILHGIATGVAIDIRIMGISIIAVTLAVMIARGIRKDMPALVGIKCATVYLCSAVIAVMMFWPWLWMDPLNNFKQAFLMMSHIPYDISVLYLGQTISALSLPWHYVPVWILITTPLLFIVFFFFGAFNICRKALVNGFRIWNNDEELQDLIFLGLFACPIISVILLHSVLYDGWRHLYFIYPSFALIATYGFKLLWDYAYKIKLCRYLFIFITAFFELAVIGWMIKAHPNSNVYFNALVGNEWYKKFDVDYWGLSNRAALEYIAQKDNSPVIRIKSASLFSNLPLNVRFLSTKFRQKFFVVDSDLLADYILDNFRGAKTSDLTSTSNFEVIHTLSVGGEKYLEIKRRNGYSPVMPVGLGEEITFGTNSKGSNYLVGVGMKDRLGFGWEYPEPWGVWSASDKVSIVLPRPPSSAEQKLILVMNALVSLTIPNQRIGIAIDGNSEQYFELKKSGSNVVEIPLIKERFPKNYISIEIYSYNRVSPKAMGLGEDDRAIGFGLVSAVIINQ